jgi:hypothetical protein
MARDQRREAREFGSLEVTRTVRAIVAAVQ